MNELPHVLIVGAGTVGQVFARHLMRSGARVTFMVRKQYAEVTTHGFDMVELVRLGPRYAPTRLRGFGVVTEMRELVQTHFDQVYLAIPSPLDPAWVAELARATGEATLVSLQPSADDHQTILDAGVDPDRLISGLIGFLAFTTPLAKVNLPPNVTAYWFPPLSPSAFSGERQRVNEVVAHLERGELPARAHRDVPTFIGFTTAILTVYLMALEIAGWSLRTLRSNGLLERATRAANEAITIMTPEGTAPPLAFRLTALPSVMHLVLAVASHIPPFPLEPYLKKHFTKVGRQTRALAELLIVHARDREKSAPSLQAIKSELQDITPHTIA